MYKRHLVSRVISGSWWNMRYPARVAVLAAVVVLATAASATAQPVPYVVKDVYAGANSSGPFGSTRVGDQLLFFADDGVNGQELWKSDGTAAGTTLVLDLRPGVAGALGTSLASVDGTLFFSATDGAAGKELWKSDGTAAGTVLISDINPGSTASDPTLAITSGSSIFFRANDGTHGTELWKSDGTAAGTQLVKDINNGASSSSAWPRAARNGVLYLSADDGVIGHELWTTDGTTLGTALLKDINSGTGGSMAFSSEAYFAFAGDTLVFQADNGVNGRELWASDGTSAGTVLIKDILPGANSSFPGHMAALGDRVYFSGSNELWQTDGTAGGTSLVKDINPAGNSSPTHLTVVGDSVLFTADDGTNGFSLWISDGTTQGTEIVKVLPTDGGTSSLRDITPAGDLLFFVQHTVHSTSNTRDYTLWVSDGTGEGTLEIIGFDGVSSTAGFAVSNLELVGDTLFFSAPSGLDASGGLLDVELYALQVPEPTGTAVITIAAAAATLLRRRRRPAI